MPPSPMFLIVAVATTPDGRMPDAHFGDAPGFAVYRVDAGGAEFLHTVANEMRATHAHDPDHPHPHGHGDEHKGHGIGQLLGQHGAQVMVSRAFGVNIQRMRQRFLPVVVHVDTVEQAVNRLRQDWDRVIAGWNAGAERKHLVLR